MRQSLRARIRDRAGGGCEYCHLPDWAVPAATFHAEHVIARQHGGSDAPGNRCWSCHRCNLKKGPNLSGRDPRTGQIVVLFHPRRQRWSRHFQLIGSRIVGRTRSGRATVTVLAMNDPLRVQLRRLLMDSGDWPPG